MIKSTKQRATLNTADEPKQKKAKIDINPKKEKNPSHGSEERKPRKLQKKTFESKSVGNGKVFQKKQDFKTGKDFKNGKFNKNTDQNNVTEKTDWRKFKQDKKDLKLKRRKAKDLYEISAEAKQIYEKLKCRRTEKKNELVQKLYDLLGADDIIKKLVMAHDTARVIQCMLKFASPTLRDEISEKLILLAPDMAISKYSHFCVLRMFKYGSPATKSKLVDSFIGNVVKLACHNISSKILDHAYLTVANQNQKIFMRQEFYGELYRKSKDANVKTLTDTYKDTPNMKASILGSVKSNLEHVANKQLLDNSLVHAVMLEYLRECDDDKIEETVSAFAPHVPLLLTTEDGSQAATICFYKSTPKNRRAIIKTIKEHLVKICTHEHGHVFMIAVLNALDDTKAIKKAIYDTIHPELKTLMNNQWGRRVIEWLVCPADTIGFHPTFIANIEEGLKYGKKDKEVRRKEIFEQIEEPITTTILEQPDFWLSNKHIGLITAEILKKINTKNFVKAAKVLAPIVVNPQWMVSVDEGKAKPKKAEDVETIITAATKARKDKQKSKEINKQDEAENENDSDDHEANEEEVLATEPGIEEAGMHIVLKKIIKSDNDRLATNDNAETFGSALVENLTDETVSRWLKVNRACFVLLNVWENNKKETKKALQELLRPHTSIIKKNSTKGGMLLLQKLKL